MDIFIAWPAARPSGTPRKTREGASIVEVKLPGLCNLRTTRDGMAYLGDISHLPKRVARRFGRNYWLRASTGTTEPGPRCPRVIVEARRHLAGTSCWQRLAWRAESGSWPLRWPGTAAVGQSQAQAPRPSVFGLVMRVMPPAGFDRRRPGQGNCESNRGVAVRRHCHPGPCNRF